MAVRNAGGDLRRVPHLPHGDLLPVGVPLPSPAARHPAPQESEAQGQGEMQAGRSNSLLRRDDPQKQNDPDPVGVHRALQLWDHHANTLLGK